MANAVLFFAHNACTNNFSPLGKLFPKGGYNLDNNRLQGGLEAVHKAEKAVVSAQQNASPETFQKAHLKLIKAQQLINELMKGEGYGIIEKNNVKLANEHLKHLFEAKDGIQH